jgi:hypothetical protein
MFLAATVFLLFLGFLHRESSGQVFDPIRLLAAWTVLLIIFSILEVVMGVLDRFEKRR